MSLSPIKVWFVCKECRQWFQQVSDFIEHKKEKHLNQFQNTTCIVFEESDTNSQHFSALESQPEPEPVEVKVKVEEDLEFIVSDSLEYHRKFQLNKGQVSANSPESDVDLNPELIDDEAFDDGNIYQDFNFEETSKMTDDEYAEEREVIIPDIKIETEINILDSSCLELNSEREPIFFVRPKENTGISDLNPFVLVDRLSSKEIPKKSSPSPPVYRYQPSRFECRTCSKTFAQRNSLSRHMQIHSDARPQFKCELCGLFFSRKDALQRHVTGIHST